jgi:hypothetical protein
MHTAGGGIAPRLRDYGCVVVPLAGAVVELAGAVVEAGEVALAGGVEVVEADEVVEAVFVVLVTECVVLAVLDVVGV